MLHYSCTVIHQTIDSFIIISIKNTYLGIILFIFATMLIDIYSYRNLQCDLFLARYISEIPLFCFAMHFSALDVTLFLRRYPSSYWLVYNNIIQKHIFGNCIIHFCNNGDHHLFISEFTISFSKIYRRNFVPTKFNRCTVFFFSYNVITKQNNNKKEWNNEE